MIQITREKALLLVSACDIAVEQRGLSSVYKELMDELLDKLFQTRSLSSMTVTKSYS